MSNEFKFTEHYSNLPDTIAREQVHHHFPYLTPGSMKNLDSRGEGPVGAFKVGKKVIYPTSSLLEWLDSRIEGVVRSKEKKTESKEKSITHLHSAVNTCKKRGRKRKDVEVRERRG